MVWVLRTWWVRWTGMDFDSLWIQLCVAGQTSSLRFPENHSFLNPVYVVLIEMKEHLRSLHIRYFSPSVKLLP